MKIFDLPKDVRCIAFDLDGTLYTNEEYLKDQYRLMTEKLAKENSLSFDEMKEEVDRWREDFSRKSNGKRATFGDMLSRRYGHSIDKIAAWRDELFIPQNYLKPNPELQKCLKELKRDYVLSVASNNARGVVKNTLLALGIHDEIDCYVGIDDSRESKPSSRPYQLICELLKMSPENTVSVGDRYDADIAPALEIGMGGILVEHVDEVYLLKDRLKSNT